MIARATFETDPVIRRNVRLADEFDEARVRNDLAKVIRERWPELKRVRYELKLDFGD